MNELVKAEPANLDDILGFFGGVQAWLVRRGLKGQWGEEPFSSSHAQRARFAACIHTGTLYILREEPEIVATLVLGSRPPNYAEPALKGKPQGGYLEAFAVRRDKRGLGSGLLSWAEAETCSRGYDVLRLDCWAGNENLQAYYKRAGFEEVSRLKVGTWVGVLFEKQVTAPP